MSNTDLKQKIQEARAALEEAESLLPSAPSSPSNPSSKGTTDNPTGVFDGQFLVTKEGKKYQVPPNYASKSQLVVGDRLELVKEADDTEGSQNFVKPIQKQERVEVEGILTKKDHHWAVVTGENTYWVLPASVEYYDGEIGDKVKLALPADYEEREDVEWGAVEEIVKEGDAPDISHDQRSSALSGEIVLEETRKGAEEGRPSLMDKDVEELR